MKKLLIILVFSGCKTVAGGVQREAAWRVRACQDIDANPMAAFAGCKKEGANYCLKNKLPSDCWVDEYTIEGLDQESQPFP